MIRGTGKSTARALEFIAMAIKEPGKWIRINDHVTPMGVPQLKADSHFAHLVSDLVFAMRLKFEFHNNKQGKFSIRSVHYGYKVNKDGLIEEIGAPNE